MREIASYVPIASSVVMPARVLEGEVAWWQAAISLGITLASAVVIVRVGEQIYRNSLLRGGGRVSLRSALRAAD